MTQSPRFAATVWRAPLTWIAVLAGLAGTTAQAALLQPPPGQGQGLGVMAPDQGRRLVTAAPVLPGSDGAKATALVLSAGVLEAVDLAAGQVTIARQRVGLHPTALRVVGPQGQAIAAGAQALRAGAAVRFALEPAELPARERRIVLVYLDKP